MADPQERQAMVEDLRRRGIADDLVITAFLRVDRALFVPGRTAAYAGHPLPIGHGQTISQPYVVAYMLQELELAPGHRALEVGAGSGYAAALLASICHDVVATERIAALARLARENLRRAGVRNCEVVHTARGIGAAERGPFDRILVSAAAESLPSGLVSQLRQCGIMLIPLRDGTGHYLHKLTRLDGRVENERLIPVSFVPLR